MSRPGITKAFWDALNEKAQWDIKVALRGPDSYYGETLKWFTTSVIRGQCRKVFRVGGTINRDLKLVILPLGHHNPKVDKSSWNYSHFIQHVAEAANWLGVPVLFIPDEVWHMAMTLPGAAMAGQFILKECANTDKYYIQDGSKKKFDELRRHLEGQLNGNEEGED